jgi:hypothetical protein
MNFDIDQWNHFMAFEILRRLIAAPQDFEAIEHAKDDPFALGRLVLALETLPALNRMQPFTNTQLAQALCLALALVNYDSIPDERLVLVRRLAVVGV